MVTEVPSGQRFSSVVQRLPGEHKVPGSISGTRKRLSCSRMRRRREVLGLCDTEGCMVLTGQGVVAVPAGRVTRTVAVQGAGTEW